MREHTKEFHINGILVLVLFGVFSVSILLVLLSGAEAYRRLTNRGQESYVARTVPQYITTKVRQADETGRISVGAIGGTQTLELKEEIDGTTYVTRIYCHGGYLRELFSAEVITLKPEDGEQIMPAEEVEFVLQDGMLKVMVLTETDRLFLRLALRSQEVADEK